MKKLLSVLLCIAMLLPLVACSNSQVQSNESTTESSQVATEATKPKATVPDKTPYEKVKEYLKTEGANYQGIYTIMHLGTTSYTISLYPDGYIYFYCSSEDENNSEKETRSSMQLYEGSVTQPVTFEYIQQGYKIAAKGTISTSLFSEDFTTVVGVTYTENFPSSVSTTQIEELVDVLFGAHVNLMLTGVEYILVKNVGVSLKDLGFTSW